METGRRHFNQGPGAAEDEACLEWRERADETKKEREQMARFAEIRLAVRTRGVRLATGRGELRSRREVDAGDDGARGWREVGGKKDAATLSTYEDGVSGRRQKGKKWAG